MKERSSPTDGLASDEAKRRLAQFGPNEFASPSFWQPLWQFLAFFANPLVLILLAASLISTALGEATEAVIIIAIVLVSATLDFFQVFRSNRAAERLRHEVAPRAKVRRDGEWREIPRREVVPGDVIRLTAGDLVPADALLFEAKDLHVQQAALTGESLPVEKEAAPVESLRDIKLGEVMLDQEMARHVVFLGTSIVSGTGMALVIATGARTAFGNIATQLARRHPETEFERGIRRFSMLIMRTVIFLVLFVFLSSVILQRNTLEAFLFAVALAVGLTPEFLPMIVTVTLTQGALQMARRKVIVRRLEAIQNFGSIDILCSDKTGTLTRGEMRLVMCVSVSGEPDARILELAYLNSFHETGINSPLDQAILQHDKFDAESWRKLDEIPFDFERRRVSVVVQRDGERLLITKGAPESVCEVCANYAEGGAIHPLDTSEARALCARSHQTFSAQGYRVLAVAYKRVGPQDAYRASDESDLTLAGFIAFSDPPLEDAAQALQALKRDGVRVKILTGDNELVARHVCQQVGLNVGRVVLGPELDRITDAALAQLAEQVDLFARVTPAQKNRVIMALKAKGHVVGFLGDGINDAPSLHAADVGISVANATDVAKESADIILLERGLKVLHDGLIEGRKSFGNVMKYLLMGTSSNFGNVLSMAAASVLLPFLPMLPVQILLNNFLYDLAQITIPTDNVDATFIHKPRRWEIGLIRDFMLYVGPISSIFDFLTFFALLKLFHASEAEFHTGWFIESLATQTLVIFIIRTAGNPLRSRPSNALALTTVTIVLLSLLLPVTPLARFFSFTPVPAAFYLFLFLVTVSYLLAVELVKRRLMRTAL